MKKDIKLFPVFSIIALVNICMIHHSTQAMDFTLLQAAIDGKDSAVQTLLDNKPSEAEKKEYAQLTDSFGRTALHWAARYGHTRVAEILLRHSCINKQDSSNGFTPLHLAVRARQAAVIDVLLRNNADVNIQDKEHNTPLHLAAKKNCWQIVAKLLQAGAKVSIKDRDQQSPLHCAVVKKREEARLSEQCKTVSLLLDAGLDVNSVDELGWTPLHEAAIHGNANMIKLLLSKGANPNIEDRYEHKPLHLVNASKYPKAVDLLCLPVTSLL